MSNGSVGLVTSQASAQKEVLAVGDLQGLPELQDFLLMDPLLLGEACGQCSHRG